MTGYRTRTPEQGTTRLAAADRWSWTDDAACKGESLELFFDRDGERAAEREQREEKATAICQQQCPVRMDCLRDALTRRDLWGVRGGYTPDRLKVEHRKHLRRAQAGRAAA